jgi:hypothetical protein
MYDFYYTVCPRIEFTRGKKILFLILRKNFRGITFFASSETPISVIKISVLRHCIVKLTCFVQIWTFYYNWPGFLTNNLLLLQNVVFRTKNLFNPMLDRFLSHNYKI